jgi:hypothetical protein
MPKNLHSCESSFSDDALAPLMTALQQEHPRTGAVDMDDDFEMEKRVLDAILDESLDGIVEEVLAEVERTEYLFEFDLN